PRWPAGPPAPEPLQITEFAPDTSATWDRSAISDSARARICRIPSAYFAPQVLFRSIPEAILVKPQNTQRHRRLLRPPSRIAVVHAPPVVADMRRGSVALH